MNIYMTLILQNKRVLVPIPSSLELNIDGTDYLVTWDETEAYKFGWACFEYRLKGVSVSNVTIPHTEEKYANGLLKDDSVCEYKDINFDEDDGDSFEIDSISGEIEDGSILLEFYLE